jgi:hypothetical protein
MMRAAQLLSGKLQKAESKHHDARQNVENVRHEGIKLTHEHTSPSTISRRTTIRRRRQVEG